VEVSRGEEIKIRKGREKLRGKKMKVFKNKIENTYNYVVAKQESSTS
jgi:hypothetical protein